MSQVLALGFAKDTQRHMLRRSVTFRKTHRQSGDSRLANSCSGSRHTGVSRQPVSCHHAKCEPPSRNILARLSWQKAKHDVCELQRDDFSLLCPGLTRYQQRESIEGARFSGVPFVKERTQNEGTRACQARD
ncbi:hypothetical protein [Pseudophaeobacter sp.]|uniref:hypothetical protein n=1 Tax=Pseudophaeobacter sp. TaxID=1971739 RepID=UPI003296EEF3